LHCSFYPEFRCNDLIVEIHLISFYPLKIEETAIKKAAQNLSGFFNLQD